MAINLGDYSKDAAARGWGAGWPSCAGAKDNIATVTTKVSGTKIPVHQRVARLIQLLADETERLGYILKPVQCGGYVCRAIAGTSRPSNHSWGLAVDLNWTDNPQTSSGKHDMPTWVPRLWNQYGFAWGGDYTGATVKDYMHLEAMGTPVQMDEMTALAEQNLGDGSTTKELDPMIEREFPEAGTYTGRIICPVGSASSIVSAAWISVSADGGGTVAVYFNKSGDTDAASPGVGNPWTGPYKNGQRVWSAVPSGTEIIWYQIVTKGPGALCIELKAA